MDKCLATDRTDDEVPLDDNRSEHRSQVAREKTPVRISGYELWKIDNDGLIAESKGHFDSAEYERQLKHGVDG